MSLEIPEADRVLLKRWLITNEEPLEQLLSALAAAAPTLRRSTLAKSVAQTTGLEQPKVEDALRVLIRLSRSISLWDKDDAAIPTLFSTIMGTSLNDAEKLVAFESNVRKVVALRSVEVTGKAAAIMTNNTNTFCSARTVSEVRPIFSDDTLKAEAAVIVHQLKIVYHTGPDLKLKEILVALDTSDLASLKSAIDRALKKDTEIAKLLPESVQLLKG